ncbi:MAG: kinetochore complex Sim4 subunit Fta1-domain-containing protein [Linnemannia elongata]|nr:MAG: kinetochore complex Sim4 subunit Fta1-domain-containing protein [Linnemannia elongata]
MATTASSSSTPANTASQRNNQNADSVIRTRHVLGSVIRSSSAHSDLLQPPSRLSPLPNRSSPQLSGHPYNRTPGKNGSEPIETPTSLQSSFLHNKTWIIHKTTPFYNYDKRQWIRYEGELLTYIAANAKNLASSALAAPTQRGAAATILNRSGPFPGQIDSSGNNVVETMDEVGDIRGVTFQVLSMNDIVNDLDDEVPGGVASTDALVITVTVKPKGRVRDQPYYCVIVPDQRQKNASLNQAFTHFGLILFKGPVMVMQLVSEWLERRFDCRICHLIFQRFELRKIVESSLEISYNQPQGHNRPKERPVELYYLLPQAVVGLKMISISLAPDDVRQLFVSREEDSKAGILKGIEAHCSESMKIDFSRLVLSRAGCSSWYIASEGKIKMFPDIETRYSLPDFIQAITVCGT